MRNLMERRRVNFDITASLASTKFRIALPEDLPGFEDSPPSVVRHNGDILEGSLEVTTPSLFEFNCTIQLEGVSRTWIPQVQIRAADPKALTGVHHFLHQTQEIPSRQYEPRNDFSLYHYSLPFRFVIPQQLVTLPPGPCEHFCDLPPSFQHGATYQAPGDSHIFMQPLISYSLNAVILFPPRPGRPHIESRITRRNISITPLSRLAPPLEIGHLQQKYSLFSAQAIKAHYWTRSLGVLEVSGMEPSPLNMLARTPRAASNLSLRLKFKPEQEFAMHVRPFEWTFLVEHSIVARTSYCTRLIGDPFDTREGNRKPYMRTVDEVVTSERRLLNNASWRLDRISDLGTISPSATPSWVTSLSLPVTARKSLIPTFTTLLGARRYCLKVKLTISNLHHTPLEVQLPLQVYFESNQDSGQVSDRQGGQAHTQNDLCDIPMNPDAPNETSTAKTPPYERYQISLV